ncbi:MAG TPA: hypothetical protein DD473_10080 [Planctomycetaceae bacterium]|nr:hypothetical protein [Planctomycetaceae bacterium]
MNEDRRTLLAITGLLCKLLRLPADSRRIQSISRFDHDRFTSLQIPEQHHIKIPVYSCRLRFD